MQIALVIIKQYQGLLMVNVTAIELEVHGSIQWNTSISRCWITTKMSKIRDAKTAAETGKIILDGILAIVEARQKAKEKKQEERIKELEDELERLKKK